MESRWHFPWYRVLFLYLCGMILGAALVMLVFRVAQQESIIGPVLGAVAMLLASASQLQKAWHGRGTREGRN
jgi:hypothetical protein